jgi:hypothetical protein
MRILPFIAVAIVLTACTNDFDQFRTTPRTNVDVSVDTRDSSVSPADAGVDGARVARDSGDAAVDLELDGIVLGLSCSENSECSGGTCLGGQCTRLCPTGTCPADAHCITLMGKDVCAVECLADGGCAGVADRTDLACVRALASSSPRTIYLNVCWTDGDADSVADVEDNCPADSNATQQDVDGDGAGDACDADIFCGQGHSNGAVGFGTATYAPVTFKVPGYQLGGWIPILGGVGSDATFPNLDFTDRWGQGTLPYAAQSFAAAPATRYRTVIGPGQFRADGPAFGRLVEVTKDGTSQLSSLIADAVFDSTMLVSKSGQVFVHGYDAAASSGQHRWTVYLVDTEMGRLVQLRSRTDGARAQWQAMRTRDGGGYFYAGVIPSDTTPLGTLVRVSPTGSTSIRSIDYPISAGPTGYFDPVLVEAPSAVLYGYDRTTGLSARVDILNNLVTFVPEMNITVSFAAGHYVSQGSGPGFTLIGRSVSDPNLIEAIGYWLACLPGASSQDSDADGVFDILDNCRDDFNADQEDLDNDWLGDVCDDDADGDGITDDLDFVEVDGMAPTYFLNDTDNDGVLNVDDPDDDNDGWPDISDPLPLDTDNDGVANADDADDDDDGYSDVSERSSGTDATNRWSFNGSGRLVYIRVVGARRTLEFADLADLGNPTVVEDPTNATSPRFSDDGAHLLALAGEPEQTQSVTLYQTSTGAMTSYDLGISLRGAEPTEMDASGVLTAITATHLRFGSQDSWQVSRVPINPIGFESIFAGLDDIQAADRSGSFLGFLGNPGGCEACRSIYRVRVSDGELLPEVHVIPEPESLRYNGAFLVIGESADGQGTSVYEVTGSIRELRPPGTKLVDSAIRMTSGGHIIVSASDGRSYDLWFYNRTKDRWYRLTDVTDDLVDIDWSG